MPINVESAVIRVDCSSYLCSIISDCEISTEGQVATTHMHSSSIQLSPVTTEQNSATEAQDFTFLYKNTSTLRSCPVGSNSTVSTDVHIVTELYIDCSTIPNNWVTIKSSFSTDVQITTVQCTDSSTISSWVTTESSVSTDVHIAAQVRTDTSAIPRNWVIIETGVPNEANATQQCTSTQQRSYTQQCTGITNWITTDSSVPTDVHIAITECTNPSTKPTN